MHNCACVAATFRVSSLSFIHVYIYITRVMSHIHTYQCSIVLVLLPHSEYHLSHSESYLYVWLASGVPRFGANVRRLLTYARYVYVLFVCVWNVYMYDVCVYACPSPTCTVFSRVQGMCMCMCMSVLCIHTCIYMHIFNVHCLLTYTRYVYVHVMYVCMHAHVSNVPMYAISHMQGIFLC